jgi:hypothetical protein
VWLDGWMKDGDCQSWIRWEYFWHALESVSHSVSQSVSEKGRISCESRSWSLLLGKTET